MRALLLVTLLGCTPAKADCKKRGGTWHYRDDCAHKYKRHKRCPIICTPAPTAPPHNTPPRDRRGR